MTTGLANALFEASRAHPEQRVGQVIVNAVRLSTGFETDLFYLKDVELAEALREYAREGRP